MRTVLQKNLSAVMCFLAGLGCVSGQTIVEKSEAAKQAETEMLELAGKKKVSLDFDNASLEYIIQFLKEQTGINMVIAPNVDASSLKLTAHLKDVSLATALKCLLSFEELDYWAAENVLVISTWTTAFRRRLETRVHDVGDLLFAPKDFYPKEIFLYSEDLYPDDWCYSHYPAEAIVELVKAAAGRLAWEAEECMAEIQEQNLFVRQLPEAHARIEYFLSDLRREREFQIRIVGHLVEMDKTTAVDIAEKKGASLSQAEAEKLLDSVQKKGKVIDSFAVNCFNGQRNGISSSKAHDYLRDYDRQVAAEAVVADPVTGSVFDLLNIDFHPFADAAGETIRLTTRFSVSKVETPIPSLTADAGVVQLPVVTGRVVATTLEVKNGTYAALEVGSGFGSGTSLALLFTIRVAKREKIEDKVAEQLFQERALARKATREKLGKARLAVDFNGAALNEVFDYLRKNTKFNFFIMNELLRSMVADEMVLTFSSKDASLAEILDRISDFHPVRFEPVDEVIAVVSPERVFEEPLLRRYYLGDFLQGESEFRLPGEARNLGLTPHMKVSYGAAMGTAFAAEELAPVLSAEDVFHLIRSNVASDTWDNQYVSIDYVSSVGLMVTHSVEVHQRIAQLIEQFRGARRRMLNLDVRFLEIPKARIAAMLNAAKGDVLLIDEESRRKLIDAAVQGKESELWKGFNVTCMNNQKVHACDVTRKEALADYDVQISTKAPAYDPITSTLTLGAAVEFTGTIDATGQAVKLEVLNYGGVGGAEEVVRITGGELQLFEVQRLQTATTATVPDGRTLVVFTTTPAPDLPDSVFLILVRPAIVR